jgi:hypothetical protein
VSHDKQASVFISHLAHYFNVGLRPGCIERAYLLNFPSIRTGLRDKKGGIVCAYC